MEYMKAIVVTAPGKVEIVNDVPIPQIGDYEALVKNKACGFCNGTDFQVINATLPQAEGSIKYPTVLGHEAAGEVVAVGKKVKYIKPGNRFIHPNQRKDVGNGYTKTFGGFAEYGYVVDHKAMLEDGFDQHQLPDRNYFAQIPDDFDLIDGGVLLSLNESFSAVRNFGITKDMNVLVYGAGPMGLAVMTYMRVEGVKSITVCDALDDRLEEAKRVAKVDRTINITRENLDEVFAGQEKFHCALDIVGKSSILLEASHRVKFGGKVGSMGVLKNDDGFVNASALKNNTVLHMLNFPYGQYAICSENVKLIQEGKINPKDFYSHVKPMEEIQEVMRLVASKEAKKVIVTIY